MKFLSSGVPDLRITHVNAVLKKLVVPSGLEEHAGLVAVCKAKGIRLI